ncbi:hypothetical protein Aperf_G00000028301 [Anoplocephala perfoliata]
MACALPTASAVTSESDESFLLSLMGKKIVVRITDGRIFEGFLMCTDNCGNIAMRDVVEHQPKDENATENMIRRLYLITIRGEFIKQIMLPKTCEQ